MHNFFEYHISTQKNYYYCTLINFQITVGRIACPSYFSGIDCRGKMVPVTRYTWVTLIRSALYRVLVLFRMSAVVIHESRKWFWINVIYVCYGVFSIMAAYQAHRGHDLCWNTFMKLIMCIYFRHRKCKTHGWRLIRVLHLSEKDVRYLQWRHIRWFSLD